MEELVAEMGAAFLCADLGLTLEIRDDHAAYIASWLKVLKNDKRAVFTAASHAQRAADHLHGYQATHQAEQQPPGRADGHALAATAGPPSAAASGPEGLAEGHRLPDPARRAQFQNKGKDQDLGR
jgi:hypothetical protein